MGKTNVWMIIMNYNLTIEIHSVSFDLFTTQKSSASPTSNCLAGYFGYVVPEVIKTPTETHTYLVDRYDLFDTHTQTRHKFISLSLCTAIITYILLCSYSPFRSNNATALAQQNAQN